MTTIIVMHQEFEPPEALRNTIKCFWYNLREFDGPRFEVVPDGYAEIIFYFGSNCSIDNNGAWQPLPSPFLMGLLNQPAVFSTQDRLEIIGIRCYPWTVFDLLGLPPDRQGLRLLTDPAPHPVAQLQSTLSELVQAGQVEQAVTTITAYFLKSQPYQAVDSTLFKAGVAMLEASGAMPVSQVAAAAHATVRTLERKFKQSSGRTVKDVSGLMRFEQARNRLWLEPDISLAALAQSLGYTDQSHLSREFKRYSGMTPSAFAQKRKP
jgi:AraC-like DNA-binding protein